MLIASVLPWHLATRAIDARMQRTPGRSRIKVIVIASLYAFFSFAAVQLVYDWELNRKGLHRAGFHPERVFRNTFEIHLVGFIVWWSISIVTAFLIQRFQRQLSSALTETRRQATELALISDVGAATTVPLPKDRIAGDFLARVRWATAGTTTAVLVRDFDSHSFRLEALAGQRASSTELGATVATETLPQNVRTAVIARGEPLVVSHMSGESWLQSSALGCDWQAGACSLLLLPLISREHLLG